MAIGKRWWLLFAVAAVAAIPVWFLRGESKRKPTPKPQPARTSTVINRDARPFRLGTQAPVGATSTEKVAHQIQLPDGQWVVPLPDGTYRYSTVENESDEPTIDGAISVRRMMHEFPIETRVLQGGIDISRNEREKCLADFVARGGRVTKYVEWNLALTFVGDGQEIGVTRVQALRDRWPDEFDDQVKDCYLESYSRIRFRATEKIDMTVEFPLCVYAASTDNQKPRE
jgi:hypothetical protein